MTYNNTWLCVNKPTPPAAAKQATPAPGNCNSSFTTLTQTMGQGASHARTDMAAPVAPAVAILTKLGIKEATAKKNVAEGKINLFRRKKKSPMQVLLISQSTVQD